MLKRLSFTVLIVCLTLLVGRVYLHSGFPYTHDGENHLARFANYKIALKERQIPPRFAPNLMNRYGYPVFNYNYPLANIISVPFSILKVNYEVTFKIIALGALAFCFTGINAWLKKLSFGNISRAFSIVAFAATPFLINIVWYRGNIGELLAVAIIPWLLYRIEARRTKVFTPIESLLEIGIWTAFLLAHNVSVLIVGPVLFSYALLRLSHDLKKFLSFLFVLTSSMLLSLWFWLPALLEKSEIVLDQANVNSQLTDHFPLLKQLVSSALGFGFSNTGSVDSLSFSLGTVFWLTTLIGVVLLVVKVTQLIRSSGKTELSESIKENTVVIFSILVVAFAIFLMLPASTSIWESIQLLQFVQFPWRLQLLVAIFSAPLLAATYGALKNLKWLLWLVLLTQVIVLARITAVDYFHRSIVDYDAFSQSTSTNNENLPKSFTYKNIGDWQPGPLLLNGEGSIDVQSWSGSVHTYTLNLQSESTVIEPTMYFLGWETTVFHDNSTSQVEYINNPEIQGRIAYILPAGTYQVVSRFTQNTVARRLGNGASILGVVIVSTWAVWQFTQQRKKSYD